MENNFKIYSLKNRTFRINELAENKFVVVELFVTKKTTGFLWWRKTTTQKVWDTVNIFGYRRNINDVRGLFIVYDTFANAEKWILNFLQKL